MPLPQGLHRVHRHHLTAPDDADAVTGALHLFKHVAGEEDGLALFLLRCHQVHKPALHERVQAAGGLVKDQDVRVVHEGGHQPQLLLHTLAHLLDFSLGLQLEVVQQLPFPIAPPQVPVSLQKFEVFHPGHVVKKADLARDIAQLGLNAGPIFPAVQSGNGTRPGLRAQKAHQMPDGGGLSRPVGA